VCDALNAPTSTTKHKPDRAKQEKIFEGYTLIIADKVVEAAATRLEEMGARVEPESAGARRATYRKAFQMPVIVIAEAQQQDKLPVRPIGTKSGNEEIKLGGSSKGDNAITKLVDEKAPKGQIEAMTVSPQWILDSIACGRVVDPTQHVNGMVWLKRGSITSNLSPEASAKRKEATRAAKEVSVSPIRKTSAAQPHAAAAVLPKSEVETPSLKKRKKKKGIRPRGSSQDSQNTPQQPALQLPQPKWTGKQDALVKTVMLLRNKGLQAKFFMEQIGRTEDEIIQRAAELGLQLEQ